MANIDRIASVQISLNTTAIKQQEFSDLLVLGPHVHGANRTMIITGASELLDIGFLPTDPIYKTAVSVFSQIPTVSRLFIGRQLVASVDATVGTAVAGAAYRITLSWIDGSGTTHTSIAQVTAGASETSTDIAAALLVAIQASPAAGVITASASGPVVTMSATVPGTSFGVAHTGNITTPVATSSELPSVALTACRAETDDWYGMTLAFRSEAFLLDAAAWAESNEKLHGITSSDEGIINPASTTDIASKCEQQQFFRTHVWFHRDADNESLDGAIAAKSFTLYPGQETWALKRLGGIEYDKINEGQAQAAFAKNANTFEQFRNFATTQNGKVAAGEWIDVIRFRDWLAEQIKINVVSAMINAEGKIPYTDPGIQVIGAAIRSALDLGVARGGIAPPEIDLDTDRIVPSYTISLPASAKIPFNDKANRILRDVRFSARLAGAIHAVQIKGSLTYAM